MTTHGSRLADERWRQRGRLAAAVIAALLAGDAIAFTPAHASSGGARPPDAAAIAHVLDRVAFGARPGDVNRVHTMGLDRYLAEQLRPADDDDALKARLADFETLSLSSLEIADRYYAPLVEMRRARQRRDAQERERLTREQRQALIDTRTQSQRVMSELAQQRLLRAVYSEHQLEEVLVDFWFNHFNVFAGKGPVQVYLTAYERDAIRPFVFGKFRTMLGAVAEHPAMLFYLDNWQSSDPRMAARASATDGPAGAMAQVRQRRPRGLNENYARELLELHTLGVDGGYTQADIVEVARAFTGWTIRTPRQGGGFRFDARRHARGPMKVLGTTIDRGGQGDGVAVLDLLARHPSTATHVAAKLARRFVADEPPEALVARAAAVFRKTDGDLREVVRVIVTSPEMLAAEARRAKVKTPFEFVVSALRASNAIVTDGAPLVRQLREMGMPLYFAQPPTGYADRADAWVNSGALLARLNFAVALAEGRVRGIAIDPGAPAARTLGSPEFQRR